MSILLGLEILERLATKPATHCFRIPWDVGFGIRRRESGRDREVTILWLTNPDCVQ